MNEQLSQEDLNGKAEEMKQRLLSGKAPEKVEETTEPVAEPPAKADENKEEPIKDEGNYISPEEIEELKQEQSRVEGQLGTYSHIELELMSKNPDTATQIKAHTEIQRRWQEGFLEKEKQEAARVKKAVADKKKAQENAGQIKASELKQRVLKGDQKAFSDLLAHKGLGLGKSPVNMDDVANSLRAENEANTRRSNRVHGKGD